MKKGMILAVALVVFAIGGIGWAADGDIGVDIDATWVSKYIWHGFDRLDDKAAFQPSITVDLGAGFSVGVWGSYAGASKGGGSLSTVNANELDYIVTYNGTVFPGEARQIDYAVNYLYYDYIDNASKTQDTQEWNLVISLPQICPGGIVPNYTVAYLYNSEGGSFSNNVTGWIHTFGIDYDIVVGEIIPNNPEQVFTFSWDITYNDGAGASSNDLTMPKPQGVDHDWSHMTWGLSTEIACPFGGTFRPGVYYQTSMEDSVNTEDELWTGLSYTLSF